MALPTFPTTEAELVEDTTSDDMLNGGHRTLFFPLLLAALALAEYAQGAGIEIETLAEQVALDAAAASDGSGTEASIANIRAFADLAHYLSARNTVAAMVPVTLTFATPLAWDMDTGINFTCTLTADTTLPNPTNQTAGKSGFIDFVQDGTGGRSITGYGNNFKWFGPEPDWPAEPAATTKVTYFVKANGEVHLAFAGNAA